jgi:ubiquinone/menaquinone biosynthesis C-methylase UbiE
MPINFHDQQNQLTYTSRVADHSWHAVIRAHVDVKGKYAVDIGCGGGIYTKALVNMGAAQVTGVDFSDEMLKGAAKNCAGIDAVSFVQGNAYNTGLPADAFEIILERALIHHLDDLDRCFTEAHRLLPNGGVLIVQDRTPQDCLLPGDANHIRGYFFERYPKLIDIEVARRHNSATVRTALEASGLSVANEVQLWETRRIYNDLAAVSQELLQRTGRSILHELTNDELHDLVSFIQEKLEKKTLPIVEKDSWTLWFAIKNSKQA